MNKLTLKILILFFLFIYSHELTDSQIIRNETKNFIKVFKKSCKEVYDSKERFLNQVIKKEKCIGYCHQYLHTKFPKTMKIKNIPHGNFTKACKILEKNLNNYLGLEKLINIDFISKYKSNKKVNNTLGDLSNKIASEIKDFSRYVKYCFKKESLKTFEYKKCIMSPIKYFLLVTLKHYSMIKQDEIIELVIKLNNEKKIKEMDDYQIGLKILKFIKYKIQNKKIRKLNENEDSLYEEIIKCFKLFCGIFK
jgi:hypothetical protein